MKTWTEWSDQKLLNTRVCDLPLSLKDSPFLPGLRQLEKELKARHLQFVPHYWLGDEWCCPEGIPGVAIPFTLAHPRLHRLERKIVAFAEGTTPSGFMKLLRHEVGHAIETAYKIDRHPLREMVFGDTKTEYPENYLPDPKSREFVRHLPDHYAQAHPDEDFAETFAVWLTPKHQWKSRYKNWGAIDKLKVMDQLMLDCRYMTPLNRRKQIEFSYKEVKETLGSFLKKRRDHYYPRLNLPEQTETLFAPKHGAFKMSTWLKNNKSFVKKHVLKGTNLKTSELEQTISKISAEMEQRNLYVKPGNTQSSKDLLDFMVKSSVKLKQDNHHRIIM